MVFCLERVADLHMDQLMPLPLTISCFSKIQIGFIFLVPAHLDRPGKRTVKRVCVFPWFTKNDYRDRASWFWHILQFLKRTCICSAYHWTTSKLAQYDEIPCLVKHKQ